MLILQDFYHNDKNKLFIRQIKSLIIFLKNITYKLEDKDIIYFSEYQEDKMYELSKNTFLFIEVLESSLNSSGSNTDIDMQKYMIKIAGLEKYLIILQEVVNSFYSEEPKL